MAFADRTGQQNRSNGDKVDEHQSKLKKIYSQQLASLKQLFNDWSEADLLATIEEVQGDLDLAISRIAEGHAAQWGEVKKRERKEKSKQAAQPAADAVSSFDHSSRPAKPFGSRDGGRPGRGGTYAGRGGRGGARGGRGGGRGGASFGGSRGGRANGSYRSAESKPDAEVSATGDWGNPADPGEWGAAPANDDTAKGGDWGQTPAEESAPNDGGWGAPAEPADAWGATDAPAEQESGGWGAVSRNEPVKKAVTKPETKPIVPTEIAKPQTPRTPAPAPKPKSWAALVKGPEPVPVAAPALVAKAEATQLERPKTPVSPQPQAVSPVRVPSPVRPPSPLKSPARDARNEAVKTPEPAPEPRVPSPTRTPQKPISRPQSPPKPLVPTPIHAPVVSQIEESAASQAAQNAPKTTAPPGFKTNRAAPFSGRKLKQDAAVVMPSNASLSSIGVQFGSLRLGGAADMDEEEKETNAPVAQQGAQVAADASQNIAASALAQALQVPSQPAQQIQQQHQQQVQQPLSQQQGVRDPRLPAATTAVPHMAPGLHQAGLGKQADALPLGGLPSTGPAASGLPNGVAPYGSYFPNQQLAAASGFGLGHMANLPAEYSGLYGTDAQARMMHGGYYDPAYQQAAASKYQAADATAPQQGAQATQGSPATGQHQQGQQQPQGGYPVPYPYYPYYHMPNQFPSYQSASPYGQPFVNKNVYPGYPQQSQQQPAAASTTPKAGNATATGYGYGSSAQQHSQTQPQQAHLYQQAAGGYDDLTGGLASHDYKSAGYGTSLPQQSFQSFGLPQGIAGVAGQSKVGGASQVGQSGQTDYKSQQPARPQRQSYDAHKYQSAAATGLGQQGATAGTAGAGIPGGQGSYYNQQHLAGLHGQQQPGQQNPYMQMHHQYQQQQSGNLYGQRQGGGQYWSGQS